MQNVEKGSCHEDETKGTLCKIRDALFHNSNRTFRQLWISPAGNRIDLRRGRLLFVVFLNKSENYQ